MRRSQRYFYGFDCLLTIKNVPFLWPIRKPRRETLNFDLWFVNDLTIMIRHFYFRNYSSKKPMDNNHRMEIVRHEMLFWHCQFFALTVKQRNKRSFCFFFVAHSYVEKRVNFLFLYSSTIDLYHRIQFNHRWT